MSRSNSYFTEPLPPMELSETAMGVQIDVHLPTSLLDDLKLLAEKLEGFAPPQQFTGRGKHDIKYSYLKERNVLRAELPRHRMPLDQSIFAVASDIEMCRRYITKIFMDIAKLLQEDAVQGVRLLSYDLLAFDFSVEMPEYEAAPTIYFRYSILEFWVGTPSVEKSEQFSQCNLAFSYTPNDFYSMPAVPAFSEIALHSRADMIMHLRKYFSLCITLNDLHFYQRMVDRSKCPDWHLRLYMHFYVKIFLGSTLMPFVRKMTGARQAEYSQKVIMDDGESQVALLFQRDKHVRIRIFDGFEERRAEAYRELADNIWQQYPQLKNVVLFDLVPRDQKDPSRTEPRLQLALSSRDVFEGALLVIYKYIYYRLERASLTRKEQVYHFKEVKNCLRISHHGFEIVIGFNDERSQFTLQSIHNLNNQKFDVEIATGFRRVLGDYIGAHFQLAGLMQIIEEFYKYRDKSILFHFCDNFRNYEEIMQGLQEQKKKDNLNKLIEMLTKRVLNDPRPSRCYRYFRLEKTGQNGQQTYDLTLKPYVSYLAIQEIRCALREKGGVIRVRTNLQEAWAVRDIDRKRVIQQHEKRSIDAIKDIGRDLKIEEFVV